MYDHLPEMLMSDDPAYRAMISGKPHNASAPIFDRLRRLSEERRRALEPLPESSVNARAPLLRALHCSAA